jgi:hypothetical protein
MGFADATEPYHHLGARQDRIKYAASDLIVQHSTAIRIGKRSHAPDIASPVRPSSPSSSARPAVPQAVPQLRDPKAKRLGIPPLPGRAPPARHLPLVLRRLVSDQDREFRRLVDTAATIWRRASLQVLMRHCNLPSVLGVIQLLSHGTPPTKKRYPAKVMKEMTQTMDTVREMLCRYYQLKQEFSVHVYQYFCAVLNILNRDSLQ